MPRLLPAGSFHPDAAMLLAERPDVEVAALVAPSEQESIAAIPGRHGPPLAAAGPEDDYLISPELLQGPAG
mgnify:CR=1 FL=1